VSCTRCRKAFAAVPLGLPENDGPTSSSGGLPEKRNVPPVGPESGRLGVRFAAGGVLIVLGLATLAGLALVAAQGKKMPLGQAKQPGGENFVEPKAKTIPPANEEPKKVLEPAENGVKIAAQPTLTAEEIAAKYGPSVGLIKTPLGHGTGFVVREGVIATNYHVIALSHSGNISVYFPAQGDAGNKPLKVDHVLCADPKLDLALIAVQSKRPALRLAQNYDLKNGQSIVVIGNPGVLKNVVSQGLASPIVELPELYQLTISINPGNSGGPAINLKGEVIGVIQSKAKQQEGIAFCVPVKELQKYLANVETLSLEDRAKLTSIHNANEVVRRLASAASVYSLGTVSVASTWRNALERFGNVKPGDLDYARAAYLNTCQKNKWDLSFDRGDIAAAVGSVRADGLLQDDVRAEIVKLFQTYEALKGDFLDVQLPTLAEYKDRCLKHLEDLEGLENHLAAKLKMEIIALDDTDVLHKEAKKIFLSMDTKEQGKGLAAKIGPKKAAEGFSVVGTWEASYKLGYSVTKLELTASDDEKIQIVSKTQYFGGQSIVVQRGIYKYSDSVISWSGTYVIGILDGFPASGGGILTWTNKDRFTWTSDAGAEYIFSRKK
jgi:S1-C subfamily serine protease